MSKEFVFAHEVILTHGTNGRRGVDVVDIIVVVTAAAALLFPFAGLRRRRFVGRGCGLHELGRHGSGRCGRCD